MMESLVSIRRAGASIIVTYYAQEAAKVAGVSSLRALRIAASTRLLGTAAMRRENAAYGVSRG